MVKMMNIKRILIAVLIIYRTNFAACFDVRQICFVLVAAILSSYISTTISPGRLIASGERSDSYEKLMFLRSSLHLIGQVSFPSLFIKSILVHNVVQFVHICTIMK